MSFAIKIHDDATIPFHSLVRTTTVSPAEIKSARAKRHALGLGDVLQGRAAVHLLNQIHGFHDFLSQVSH
jgi:hypothetical protein